MSKELDAKLKTALDEFRLVCWHHPVYQLSVRFVFCWIASNLVFKQHTFDEYPFPLLAMILALEAILLTSCVLIRQSTIDQTLERRDHLELQINLLAEREATQLPAYTAAGRKKIGCR